MVALSRALPTTRADLGPIRELPNSLARRHGEALLETLARAKALPEDELPRRLTRQPRLAKDPGFDARLELLKTARNRIATELGLEPGVLGGRGTLEAVARARPTNRAGLEQVAELRRWQIEVLGDAFLEALR
ncbi:MAG: hypothetical protein DMD62_07365 [Gemmatimonadetes bacterium]|nr:MAG: hypothetical protein DMD62_07365 [Gemmatimonadota bacterium]